MTTSHTLKEIIDLPEWRPLCPTITATSAGSAICGDLRDNEDRDPNLYYLASNTLFQKYNVKNDEWIALPSPALTNSLAAGSDAVMKPDWGPNGTLTTGNTTSSVVLSTALPAAVAVNQLANRGDGRGYKIRIIGKSSGGSGKTEERIITGNTAGTTPTIYLDSALSFTPASGDGYEMLSGRVYLLGTGAIGASTSRYYDIATNSYTSLTQTNLPATIGTDSHMVPLCECYTPYDRKTGEGFIVGAGTYNGGTLNCLTATATAAGTISGQSSGGDYEITANEYRNFQIRIVEDTGIPTAVGQRRRITSHTGGASTTPVYTLATNWTVTPSATAKYVLEFDYDKIILFSTAATTVYNCNVGAGTWDTTTWAARGNAVGAGVCGHFSFGVPRDVRGNTRHSYLFSPRGGASSAIDILDIAGAATGSWTADIAYGNKSQTFTTGTCGIYNPLTEGGKYYYININGGQRSARFDMLNRVLEPYGYLDYTQGTAVVGRRTALISFFDGNTTIPFFVHQRMANTEMFQNLIFR